MSARLATVAALFFALAILLAYGVAARDPELTGGGSRPLETLIGGEAALARLSARAGYLPRVAYHSQTGKIRFVGADAGRPIPRPAALAQDSPPEAVARAFLADHGSLFGLVDPAQELTLLRERLGDGGRTAVRFQQVHRGVPIVGGELIVELDAAGNILAATGEILPAPSLDVVPAFPSDGARERALAAAMKEYGLDAGSLAATEPRLWVYSPALFGAPGPNRPVLVWRLEVRASELLPVRDLVFVDAQRGGVLLRFNQIDAGRSRRTYDANNTTVLPGTLRCDEASPDCLGGDAHEVAAHRFAGATYDFFALYHGRDSIDAAGLPLTSTVHYGSSYDNAFWNGEQMVYGDKYGFPLAEDVVAHELTHGITQYESNLFYFMQSGAINESFSDIWGEFVDQLQVTDNDVGDTRWLLGEDVAGLGAMRNMKNPPQFGDPDRMTSASYWCDISDNGGVHVNSGVANKTAYLLSDGDTFNGHTVVALGITKTVKIYYEAQTSLLTSASDYQDLYDALIQACANLVGSDGITVADCQAVRDAVEATEMKQQPVSCAATHAPVCPVGQTAQNLFFDDLENPTAGNWVSGPVGGGVWYYPQNPNPYGDLTYATSGRYNFFGDDLNRVTNAYIAMTAGISLPVGSSPYLRFMHSYAFESDASHLYDGGVVEYSANGGPWQDAGALFVDNGYDGTVTSGYGNPLAGRSAFGWTSHGYISSRLDLATLAGSSVRFRFRIGTDSTGYGWGWFVDDVRLYTCALEGVRLSGPTTGTVGLPSVFTATVNPVTATLPITYVWEASGQPTVTHFLSATVDTVSYTWAASGTKAITVTASNETGRWQATGSIAIGDPWTPTPTATSTPSATPTARSRTYLPLAVRSSGDASPTPTPSPTPGPRLPNDPGFGSQWGLTKVGAPAAWSSTLGTGVVIAVVDTGVDLAHPDLAANLVPGWNLVNVGAPPQDDNGHGTHVAGIAAAVTDNYTGVAGMAWDGRIMPVKVLDSGGSGWSSDIAGGINWAVDNGAKVVNLSLGSQYTLPAVQDATDYAFNHGALVVAAAGNCADPLSYAANGCTYVNPVIYPAAYPNVLAVGATTTTDTRESYSEYGFFVDVTAPGQAIYSTWLGGGYTWDSGTSMASPLTAGLAALVWSRNPSLTNAQVAAAIMSSAWDLGTTGRDDYFGYGRLDAAAAVASMGTGVYQAPREAAVRPHTMFPGGGPEVRPGVVLVRFKPGVLALDSSSVLDRFALRAIGQVGELGVLVVEAPLGEELGLAARLAADPSVEYAHPDYRVQVIR